MSLRNRRGQRASARCTGYGRWSLFERWREARLSQFPVWWYGLRNVPLTNDQGMGSRKQESSGGAITEGEAWAPRAKGLAVAQTICGCCRKPGQRRARTQIVGVFGRLFDFSALGENCVLGPPLSWREFEGLSGQSTLGKSGYRAGDLGRTVRAGDALWCLLLDDLERSQQRVAAREPATGLLEFFIASALESPSCSCATNDKSLISHKAKSWGNAEH